jgi:hypothetical protein
MEKVETDINYFPKDVIELLTREMTQPDLIRFCNSQMTSRIKSLCNSNDFWMRRMQKDFPYFYEIIKNNTEGTNKNIKQMYLQIFSTISRQAERITEYLEKYLKPEIKKEDLYDASYKFVLNIIEYKFEGETYESSKIYTNEDSLFFRFEEYLAPLFPSSLFPGLYIRSKFTNEFVSIFKDNIFDTIYNVFSYIEPDEEKREKLYYVIENGIPML